MRTSQGNTIRHKVLEPLVKKAHYDIISGSPGTTKANCWDGSDLFAHTTFVEKGRKR